MKRKTEIIDEIKSLMEERLSEDLIERYSNNPHFQKEWEEDLIAFKEVMAKLGRKVNIKELKRKGLAQYSL